MGVDNALETLLTYGSNEVIKQHGKGDLILKGGYYIIEEMKIEILKSLYLEYPLSNEQVADRFFNGNVYEAKQYLSVLKNEHLIENGTSYHYHWLTEEGKKYCHENTNN